MKTSDLSRSALSVCVAVVLLAGCGGSQPLVGAPRAMPQTSAIAARTDSASYKVVYSFGAAPDGNSPVASLISVRGMLYGTTVSGGSHGNGTVFSITPGGTEKVLYRFDGGTDGASPQAALIHVNGTLYGTTYLGGALGKGKCGRGGAGTVFSVTTSGSERVLHSFSGAPDGACPAASLRNVNGTLYGTTYYGGKRCLSNLTCGTVFSITTGGTEKVLYRFGKGGGYGFPAASLIGVNGTLYGTTENGGACGAGAVFSITTGGTEKVLHSFCSSGDGWFPTASLLNVNGTLYGTTAKGGKHCLHGYNGCGTVFSITTSGTEKVLHSFGKGTDGIYPDARLIEVAGTLYGTTQRGGAYFNGTVFSITPGGTEKVLHSFGYGTDGRAPFAGLIGANGTLYGTTNGGGTYNNGTVFALTR